MANTPLTVNVPIRGVVLLRIDGVEGYHEVGEFTQDIPIEFSAQHGAVGFQFTDKMWREAIQARGVEGPTPQGDSVWAKARAATLEILANTGELNQSDADLAEAIVANLSAQGCLK